MKGMGLEAKGKGTGTRQGARGRGQGTDDAAAVQLAETLCILVVDMMHYWHTKTQVKGGLRLG